MMIRKVCMVLAFLVALLCAGCASNPDAAAQVLSGILMGIGQAL